MPARITAHRPRPPWRCGHIMCRRPTCGATMRCLGVSHHPARCGTSRWKTSVTGWRHARRQERLTASDAPAMLRPRSIMTRATVNAVQGRPSAACGRAMDSAIDGSGSRPTRGTTPSPPARVAKRQRAGASPSAPWLTGVRWRSRTTTDVLAYRARRDPNAGGPTHPGRTRPEPPSTGRSVRQPRGIDVLRSEHLGDPP